jgi:hypothetical protein
MSVVLDDLTTLPEVHASELTADLLTQAIHLRGAIIVRNLLPRAVALTLDQTIQRVFAAIDANRREQGLYEPVDDPKIDTTHKFVSSFGCGLMVNSPVALAETIAAYEKHGVIDLLTEQLGERPVLSSQKSTLRRAAPRFEHDDVWHQDGSFMGGVDLRVTNVWTALTDCGVTSPGVEISATRFTSVIPPNYGISVSAKRAAKHSPISVAPKFAAGDAVMFDHLCLHRTAKNPAFTEERRALETWFFPPSCYPHEFDAHPIVI